MLILSLQKTTYLHKIKKKVWYVAHQKICNVIFFFNTP